MATGFISRTDLNELNNIVQNTQMHIPKEFIIASLRDEFSKDSYYHYVSDPFGFPLVKDHTNLPVTAGLEDDETTRIFIAEAFFQEVTYYPAILVKAGSSRSVPISINRNKETVQNTPIKVIDGYGNETVRTVPTHFLFAGAWEGTIQLDIYARDILARDELVAFCKIFFEDLRFEELRRAGILVKSGGVSASAPSESYDRDQEPLYKQSINLDIRTEWRREIPIDNIITMITFCVDFGRLDVYPPVLAPNIAISTTEQLVDQIESI